MIADETALHVSFADESSQSAISANTWFMLD